MEQIVEQNGQQRASLARMTQRKTSRTRVLLAIQDLAFHQEVLDFLERDPRVDVVGAVGTPHGLFRQESVSAPDVTIACPVLTREVRHPAGSGRSRNLMVVGEEMTVPLLRDAIDAGANGVFAWPEERDELVSAVAAVRGAADRSSVPRGRVVAVFGPRGGSGTTFLATHLAAAFADQGRRCVLVDLDATFADVNVALGIEPDLDVRSVADLVAVAEELAPDHVESALFRHPRGFGALLAPAEPAPVQDLPVGIYAGTVALLALAHDMVVLHAPRCLGDVTRAGLAMADEVIVVVSPDLFSLYSARRALAALDLEKTTGRCRVVINPLARGEIGVAQIEGILGVRPDAGIRFDPAVPRAQARGRLLQGRSHRAWRDVSRLARRLVPGGDAAPHPDQAGTSS